LESWEYSAVPCSQPALSGAYAAAQHRRGAVMAATSQQMVAAVRRNRLQVHALSAKF
jgi:hypothetical protein